MSLYLDAELIRKLIRRRIYMHVVKASEDPYRHVTNPRAPMRGRSIANAVERYNWKRLVHEGREKIMLGLV